MLRKKNNAGRRLKKSQINLRFSLGSYDVRAYGSRPTCSQSYYLRIKAAKVVFSLAEVLLMVERGKKNAVFTAFNSNKWCPRLDLNQHTFRHMLLRHTCIPISPHGHTTIISQNSRKLQIFGYFRSSRRIFTLP